MLAFLAGLGAGVALAAWHFRRRALRFGRLLSFGGHEINTPITAINMTVLNLLSGVFGSVKDDQRQWVEMMREQVVRLNGLVGELRDLIHVELHGGLRMDLGDISAEEALEPALKAVRQGCARAGVGIEVSLPKGLPTLRGDPERLSRTLTSLLLHARKFRAAGDISVSAGPRDGRRQVEFLVEYTGPRLTPEEAARSLDLFYPAEKRRRPAMSATGFGLGLLKHIMRRQGGDLELTVSAEGRACLRLLVAAA